MQAVHGEARKTLGKTWERMCRYTDPHRKEPPVYQVGDLVMLNSRKIQTCPPSRKLDHKNHGPFQVEKVISPIAVKLMLPRNGESTTCSTSPFSNPTKPAICKQHRTRLRYSGKRTTSKTAKNTMWTKSWAAPKRGRRVRHLVKWLDYPD